MIMYPSKSRLGLILLLLLAAGCAPPEAADSSGSAQPAGESKKSGLLQGLVDKVTESKDDRIETWTAGISHMADQLELDAEQRKAVEEVAQQHLADLKSWLADQGEELAGFEKQLIEAAKSRDLSKVRSFKDKATQLRDEFKTMLAAFDSDVKDALGEDLTVEWQGQQLAQRFQSVYDQITFTEDQQAKLRSLALETAKSVKDQTNPQAAGLLELEKRFRGQVLADDQSSTFDEIQKANPMRSLESWWIFESPE